MAEFAKMAVLHLLPMDRWLKAQQHLKDDIHHCKIKGKESVFKDVECIYMYVYTLSIYCRNVS